MILRPIVADAISGLFLLFLRFTFSLSLGNEWPTKRKGKHSTPNTVGMNNTTCAAIRLRCLRCHITPFCPQRSPHSSPKRTTRKRRPLSEDGCVHVQHGRVHEAKIHSLSVLSAEPFAQDTFTFIPPTRFITPENWFVWHSYHIVGVRHIPVTLLLIHEKRFS